MGLFKKDRDLTQVPTQVELVVDCSDLRMKASEVNLRLDAFLSKYLTWRSRTSIQALIHDGFVLVDAATPDAPKGKGTPVVEKRPGRRLKHGSKVVVVIPEELRVPMLEKSSDELVILYEDEGVLAVEKPALVPVHPSGRHMTDTLIQRVHARYGRGYDLERGGAPRLCHRLDRETSGIVLVGKHPEAHADVMKQFERRKVEKEYLAIVTGVPEREGGVIDMPLGPARAGTVVEIKIVVAVDGWPSRTDWKVVSRHADCALVSASPFTGRQHQIRVHLAAIGHPVVGDKIYASAPRSDAPRLRGHGVPCLAILDEPRASCDSRSQADRGRRPRSRVQDGPWTEVWTTEHLRETRKQARALTTDPHMSWNQGQGQGQGQGRGEAVHRIPPVP